MHLFSSEEKWTRNSETALLTKTRGTHATGLMISYLMVHAPVEIVALGILQSPAESSPHELPPLLDTRKTGERGLGTVETSGTSGEPWRPRNGTGGNGGASSSIRRWCPPSPAGSSSTWGFQLGKCRVLARLDSVTVSAGQRCEPDTRPRSSP